MSSEDVDVSADGSDLDAQVVGIWRATGCVEDVVDAAGNGIQIEPDPGIGNYGNRHFSRGCTGGQGAPVNGSDLQVTRGRFMVHIASGFRNFKVATGRFQLRSAIDPGHGEIAGCRGDLQLAADAAHPDIPAGSPDTRIALDFFDLDVARRRTHFYLAVPAAAFYGGRSNTYLRIAVHRRLYIDPDAGVTP